MPNELTPHGENCLCCLSSVEQVVAGVLNEPDPMLIDRGWVGARHIRAVVAAVRPHAWREVAQWLRVEHPWTGARYSSEHMATDIERRAAELTQCSGGTCDFDSSGEPCDTHERLMSHAEGDHGLCGDTCAAELEEGRDAT